MGNELSSDKTNTAVSTVKDNAKNVKINFNQPKTIEINLISFDNLKQFGSFPCYGSQLELITPLHAIDRYDSFIIFISHAWLRDIMSNPHPDNAGGDKYRICIADYHNPYSIPSLESIFDICDCLFTPVVKNSTITANEINNNLKDDDNSIITIEKFEDIKLSGWNEDEKNLAYMARGWCRLEMFYNAYYFISDVNCSSNRVGKMQLLLKENISKRKRMHIICINDNQTPKGQFNESKYRLVLLPDLSQQLYEKYNPSHGQFSFPVDSSRNKHLNNVSSVPKIKLKKRNNDKNDTNNNNNDINDNNNNSNNDNNNNNKNINDIKSGQYDGDYNMFWQKHGNGKFIFENNDVYEGHYNYDLRDGYGILKYSNGNKYEGNWLDDKKNGHGVMVYNNGARYDGEFKNGIKEGYGIYILKNGDIYEGEFVDGKRCGKCIIKYVNGNQYEGNFQSGKKNDENGILRYKNGNRYEGCFVDDMREGFGLLYFSNGNRYVGNWHIDKKNGDGVMYYNNGDIYK
eukprot:gene14477-19433_t